MRTHAKASATNDAQAGFTLIESLVAILILAIGLMAVSNLFIVVGSSNKAANHSSAATAEAVEIMERLRAIPFTNLSAATGGNLTADAGSALNCSEPAPFAAPPLGGGCVITGNFNMFRDVQGVGRIKTRWTIVNPGVGGSDTLFFTVRSESLAPIVGGARSRAEFTMFRTCTLNGCPP